jgi:c-di-GMP-binding flagellar brake protein YcgR
MDIDRRKDPRIDFHLELTIEGYKGATEIRDLSLGGLMIKLDDPSRFSLGDGVVLTMLLPFEDKPIDVKAKVVRITSEGIGVEYVKLSPYHKMIIEQCFHIFKSTMPIASN